MFFTFFFQFWSIYSTLKTGFCLFYVCVPCVDRDTMDLDIERYNYALSVDTEYSIRTIAGLVTQLIDSPVSRSSLLFENQSLLFNLGRATQGTYIDSKQCHSLVVLKRRDMSSFLVANESRLQGLYRGFPILLFESILSNLITFGLDKYLPSMPGKQHVIHPANPNQRNGAIQYPPPPPPQRVLPERQRPDEPNGFANRLQLAGQEGNVAINNGVHVGGDGVGVGDEGQGQAEGAIEEGEEREKVELGLDDQAHYYSLSMHIYNRVKLNNLHKNGLENGVGEQLPIHHDVNANPRHPHGRRGKWRHRYLVRKLLICLLSSLATYPLCSMYTRIAFDIKQHQTENQTNQSESTYKYPVNLLCTNLFSVISKQITLRHQQSTTTITTPSGPAAPTRRGYYREAVGFLYEGFGYYLARQVCYNLIVHYIRELFIEIAPMLHSQRWLSRLSNRSEPFEYIMLVWWIPPLLARIVTYPLLKMQTTSIVLGQYQYRPWRQLAESWTRGGVAGLWPWLKGLFFGCSSNTSRYTLETQMCELFGLWALIRKAYCCKYEELLFVQDKSAECPLCYGEKGRADYIFVPCGHRFCKTDAWNVVRRNLNCPVCRCPIRNSFSDLGRWKKLFLL